LRLAAAEWMIREKEGASSVIWCGSGSVTYGL
jgi:hypothetical protein